jgi:hypothetical protein
MPQLIGAGIQPVHLPAPGPAGIGQHVSIPPVALGFAGIQVSGAAHRQAGHVRNRRAPPCRHGEGELGDRAPLAGHQPQRAMPGGPVQQRLQGRLIVDHGPGEQPLALIVRHIGQVLLLADIQPDSRLPPAGLSHRHTLLRVPKSPAWEGR